MTQQILIDGYHISIVANSGLSDVTYEAIARMVRGKRFRSRLHRAVRHAFRSSGLLRLAKVVLT